MSVTTKRAGRLVCAAAQESGGLAHVPELSAQLLRGAAVGEGEDGERPRQDLPRPHQPPHQDAAPPRLRQRPEEGGRAPHAAGARRGGRARRPPPEHRPLAHRGQ